MKKMRLFISIIISFILLASCDSKFSEKVITQQDVSKNNAITQSVQNSNSNRKIDNLFDHANLNYQASYIEKKFSISAISKGENFSTYEVENCILEFGLTKKENIDSITIYPNDNCILEVFDNDKTNTLTFEKLLKTAIKEKSPATLQVTCPSSCGHSQEPEYTIIFHGASVSGFLAISYTTRNPEGDYEWEELVRKKLNVINLDDDLAFRENDELFKVAGNLLKKGDIYKISLFSDIK